MASQRNRGYTLSLKEDARELRQWKCNRVEFHPPSNEWQVTLTPRSRSDCNPAQHTTHLPLTECQMATQVASGDAAAERRRAHSKARGATAISSATSRTARSKRDSWDKTSGIDGVVGSIIHQRVYDVCLNKRIYWTIYRTTGGCKYMEYLNVERGPFSASFRQMWE